MAQPLQSLLERTKELLAKDPRNTALLAREAGVGYFWLRKFRAGFISKPGVQLIEQLNNALTLRLDAK